ncbi:MAG: EamA family transporter, partial [Paracoccaceae bacterium]
MITNPNLRLLAAVLLMFMTIASFTMMAIAGRYVSDELDTFEIMMYRSLIGFILILSFTIMTKRFHTIQIAFLRDHFLRNVFHFSAQNLWFYAITVIPLVQVFALEFTVPIWILILSPFFLGEVFTRPRAIAAILGFIGILIITRPDAETLNTGTIAAGLAALGFAGSIMLTKGLTRKQNT